MRLSRKEFDRLVERAIAALPRSVARWIDEVPIIVEDAPARSDREETLGLYEGQPLSQRSIEDSGRLPSRIFIYRQTLLAACVNEKELAEEIRKTLLHELGHHAGMNEEELERLGYGDLEDPADIDFDIDEED